ncbi:ATP-binding protein [Alteromonas sp. 5E99-2]|uniref:ATP-binding protein n=1 Tax=Alteromonas sp. 5E99-2 TaxID=2817683 RepID=UPI001A97F57C|nr:ATP-binding protein [Alteromonas sp. 5E99-2]MBO1256782.1 ATP-binding protein [Alteromonas sp. 5E99-2]
MESFKNKLDKLARSLGKPEISQNTIDYKSMRKVYDQQANDDIKQLQQHTKLKRIEAIHGKSDLNPKWTFENLSRDSEDVIEAISIAESFIAAHDDLEWRTSSSHMMLFYGDYGRGKSHIAGAIAHKLIDQHEISVLYRQLSTLLEMRFFSYDFSSQDNIGEKFRQAHQQLLDVDLLILDEVCVNETVLKKNAQSWLGHVLRQRSADNKNCILISNHNLKELEHALGKYCFESIKEYDTYKVRFSGPSRRNTIVPEIPESHSSNSYKPNQVK